MMLQRILRDMYVDPEILAELDDDNKQALFCKMRAEQVRRWKIWDDKADDEKKMKTIKNKNVGFLEGIDGEPWVWVMGEHENDKSIDDILKEEAIEKAREMAEIETEELRKQMESEYIEMPKIEDLTPINKLAIEDDMNIYCSIEEIQKMIHKPKQLNNYSLNHYVNKNNKIAYAENRDVFQEISPNTQKVAQRVALWEKRLHERTSEIFQTLQKKQLEVAKEAEEEGKKKEQLWREQGKATLF